MAAQAEPTGPLGHAPQWLCAVARAEWVRIAAALDATKLAGDLDRGALEVLCDAYARWREAARKVRRKDGMVFKTKSKYSAISPWVTVSSKYAELYRRMCMEFGLTPASRLPGASDGDGKPDEDEDFLSGAAAPKTDGRQETRPLHS